MSRWLLGAAVAFALAAAGAAQAQKVYRCGPDGRLYQQTPCNDGQALDAGDARSAEQRKAAQGVARSEAKAAARFDRELAAPPAPAAKAAPPAPAASAAKAAKPKPPVADKPTIYLAPVQPPANAAKP